MNVEKRVKSLLLQYKILEKLVTCTVYFDQQMAATLSCRNKFFVDEFATFFLFEKIFALGNFSERLTYAKYVEIKIRTSKLEK